MTLRCVLWCRERGWLPAHAVKGVNEDHSITTILFSSEGSYVTVQKDMSNLSWTRCLSRTQIWLLLQTWIFLVNSLDGFDIIVTLPRQSMLQFQTWQVHSCTSVLQTIQALFGNLWHHTNGKNNHIECEWCFPLLLFLGVFLIYLFVSSWLNVFSFIWQ